MKKLLFFLPLALILLVTNAIAAPKAINVTSSDIISGGTFGNAFVCTEQGGSNQQPSISWTLPKVSKSKIKSVVVVLYDANAEFVHHAVVNIPKGKTTLDSSATYGRTLLNDFGLQQYDGPCPPLGEGSHTYYYIVYGLKSKVPSSYTDGLTLYSELTIGRLKNKIIARGAIHASFGE